MSAPLQIELIKLNAKFDTLMQTQQLRDAATNSELRHIREDINKNNVDHETRIRNLESRRYVEPKTVWAATATLTALGGLAVAIINAITK